MGQAKKQWQELEQVLLSPPVQPSVKPPAVHILTCMGRPVGVYVDKSTAEYEMHLCKQADEYLALSERMEYALMTLPLATHRWDA